MEINEKMPTMYYTSLTVFICAVDNDCYYSIANSGGSTESDSVVSVRSQLHQCHSGFVWFQVHHAYIGSIVSFNIGKLLGIKMIDDSCNNYTFITTIYRHNNCKII